MKLTSVTLSNFRCFGPAPQTVPFDEAVTALLGANGAGKSAVLAALSKVFGLSGAERTLLRSDFHLPRGKTWEDVGPITALIELRFELSELKKAAGGTAPAAMFKHMTVAGPDGTPYCVARLTATWTSGPLAEGDIDQELVWVVGQDEKGNEKTLPLTAAHRAMITVHYIPATRDPIRHIRQSAGSVLHRFLRAIVWNDATKKAVEDSSLRIRDSIGAEPGMKTVTGLVETCWQELHKEGTHTNVTLQPVAKRIEDIIRQVDTVFSPTIGNSEQGVEMLSDGQRSLFYIALVAMSFDVYSRLAKDDKHGLDPDQLLRPVLTVFAVEEPENHVSPHYLGRIITLLNRIAANQAGQVLITSHSAAIMARIPPEGVRHLLCDKSKRESAIRQIVLPTGDPEKEKFVRQAVRAYPELYFSQLVVLGEGDSEQLVVPRLLKAIGGLSLDENEISFVPLGGRHVNHLWRLLDGLGIPYVTLLDLDLGRPGGGWGRVKYAIEQLAERGIDISAFFKDGNADCVKTMHTWPSDTLSENLLAWLKFLESHNVFFSTPLDLDYAMLGTFPDQYRKLQLDERGPQPSTNEALAEAVLGVKSPAFGYYLPAESDSFSWYRYLFLRRGKPATHSIALQTISDEDLKTKTPDSLKRLAGKAAAAVKLPETCGAELS